jgi:hypothetical protein
MNWSKWKQLTIKTFVPCLENVVDFESYITACDINIINIVAVTFIMTVFCTGCVLNFIFALPIKHRQLILKYKLQQRFSVKLNWLNSLIKLR